MNLIYENNDFVLSYPKNWSKIDIDKPAAMFLPPGKELFDLTCEKITVASTPFSEFATLPALKGKTISLENLSEAIMNEAKKKGEIKDFSDLLIDSIPAKRFVLFSSMGSANLKVVQVLVIKNSKLYLFSYSALENSFDNFYLIFEEMMSSIKLK